MTVHQPDTVLAQIEEPGADAFVPGTQLMQSDDLLLPVVFTYLPAMHAMQSYAFALPTVSTYFPAPHSKHILSLTSGTDPHIAGQHPRS